MELVIKERAAQTCLLRCESSAVCRGQEGYRCADDGICWNPAPPYWRPAVAAGDCARWWGQAGERLSRCDAAKDNYVVINKGARNVSLCRRGSLVAAFRGGLGAVPVGDKKFQGDKKTPEGVFYVAQKNPDSSYYRALVLSYPDPDDAADGLAAGLIEPREKVAIEQAHAACEEPPQDTGLGGLIELHGFGGLSDWTAGCIAIENQEMDRVWEALAVNDTIVVVP